MKITDTFTAECACGWGYTTGERMIRDHEVKWHRCEEVSK